MAGAIMSDLALRIHANTAELQQGINKANNQMKSGFGKVKGMIKGMGIAAIAAGFAAATKKVIDFSKQVSKSTQLMKQLSQTGGETLNRLTGLAMSISNVYQKEFSEIAQAAKNLSGQMGISMQAALGLINEGFAAGADTSGEFLAQLKEYPTHFKAAGYTAEEMLAVFSKSEQMGIFSDKGADTIKEGTIRLREMTNVTREALDGIGISSKSVQEGLRDGSKSIREVINMISRRMAELPPQSAQVGTAIADIFGGAGEDAGLQFITGIHQISGGLEEMQTEYGKAQSRLVESSSELNTVWSKMFGESSTGWTNLKATVVEFTAKVLKGFVKGLVDVINYFIKLYNESILVRAVFETLKFAIKTVVENIKFYVKTMINIFKGLGKVMAHIFNPKNWKKGFGKGLKEIIQEARDAIKGDAIALGKTTYKNFKEGIGNIKERDPVEFVDNPLQKGKDIGEKVTEGIKQGISQGVKSIKSLSGLGIDTAIKTPGQKKEEKKKKDKKVLDTLGVDVTSLQGVPEMYYNIAQAQAAATAQHEASLPIWEGFKETIINTGADLNLLSDMFSGLGGVIAQTLSGTQVTFKSFWKFFKEFIKGLIIKLVAALAAAVALALALAALGIGAGTTIMGTVTSGSMGKNIGGFFKNMAGLADGGIAYGDTLARVGEYQGVKSNPEVIAPLNKLKGMLGGIGGGGQLVAVVKGEDLAFIYQEHQRKQNNTY